MKASNNVIKVEDFLKLQELSELNETPVVETETEVADLIDFGAFRQKTQAKKARRAKAKVQAVEMIKIVKGLVYDYEDQMTAIAHEINGAEWSEKHEGTAFDQIRDDMRRLYAFVNTLEVAVEFHGAATLSEACEMIRKGDDSEAIQTLDYILQSEYLGFQAIAKVLQVVYLNEENYFFNSQSLCETYRELETAGFTHSIEPIASACFEEALAI
ncbi:MAG: hypothetical protein K8R69_09445 [Deltaproteobacteria bacterium]|nr:hypothetical protein [Deltaproteobacteria bacterium]